MDLYSPPFETARIEFGETSVVFFFGLDTLLISPDCGGSRRIPNRLR